MARRSQRQIDRDLKEEAERIRKENQALLQREREQMKSSSSTASSPAEHTPDETELAAQSLPHGENTELDEYSDVSLGSKPKTKRSSGQTVALGRYVTLNGWYAVYNKSGAHYRSRFTCLSTRLR